MSIKVLTLAKLEVLVNQIKSRFAKKEDVTIQTVKVNGSALTPDQDKAVNVVIPEGAEYSVIQATTEQGYSTTYSLTKDGVEVGAKINIPRDMVVSAANLRTVETADTPYEGAVVGDKYIDLTIANATNDHIYLPVNDLVDVYTAGNGVSIVNNGISVVVDSSNANGLSVGASGLALAAATTSAAGAMSSADKTKLDGVATGAQVNVVETVKVNGTALIPDGTKAVDVTVPELVEITDSEIAELFADSQEDPTPESGGDSGNGGAGGPGDTPAGPSGPIM